MKPVALIHAGSMTEEDQIDANTISRLNKGIELLDNRETEHLVLAAGCGSKARWRHDGLEIRVGYSTKNLTHEMSSYLAKHGLPARYILAAPWGRDTIGEVYFTGEKILKPRRWRELLAVTNEWHAPRTKTLHEFILGPRYRTEMRTVRTLADVLPGASETKELEEKRLARFYSDFGDLNPGDSKALEERLYTKHDLYKCLPPMKQVRFYGS